MPRLTGDFTHGRTKARVIVQLTCGCRVKSRVVPFGNASMGCTSGLGHGYNLRWTEACEEGGKTFYNDLPQQRKEQGEG